MKNRYNDPTANKRFVIGVDRAKMKLYDLEESAQKGISDSGIQAKIDEPALNRYQSSQMSRPQSSGRPGMLQKDFSKIKV